MTRPKKPAKAKLAPLDAPPIELTPAEKALLGRFRATDDKGRAYLGEIAFCQAERWPRVPAPRLRLITGGAPP